MDYFITSMWNIANIISVILMVVAAVCALGGVGLYLWNRWEEYHNSKIVDEILEHNFVYVFDDDKGLAEQRIKNLMDGKYKNLVYKYKKTVGGIPLHVYYIADEKISKTGGEYNE